MGCDLDVRGYTLCDGIGNVYLTRRLDGCICCMYFSEDFGCFVQKAVISFNLNFS